ncbi:ribose 5-phosphate isomerase A, partial [Candidatus Micrarchaeota archaeon]|nr:ribose 5-phosphate isomerase A [Candidatus Micrarchaeota archaeon]
MSVKSNAAKKALELIDENQVIGLGSGTTAAEFHKLLGEKVMQGFKVDACVPTSFEARINAIDSGLSKLLADP